MEIPSNKSEIVCADLVFVIEMISNILSDILTQKRIDEK